MSAKTPRAVECSTRLHRFHILFDVWRRASAAGVVLFAAFGCEPVPTADSPVFLVDRVDEAESSYDESQFHSVREDATLSSRIILDGESRLSLTPPVSSRFAFDVRVPETPVLRFAIGASPLDEPGHWPPIEFQVSVDAGSSEEVLFVERLNRHQANQWLDREVDLSPWEGRMLRVVLETGVPGTARRARRAARRVMPVWGNPVLSSRKRRGRRPNVVLVSIDTLRADHLGVYGYHRPTSPNIDALAADGLVFESASSVSAWTLPTHMSMLTGLLPSLHGVRENKRLSQSVALLPELLAEAGYRVDGVASWYFLSQTFGFDRGFHSYRLRVGQDAEDAVDTAIELVRAADGQDQFLFVHLVDPHWPYLPPDEWIARFGRPKEISELLDKVVNRIPPRGEDEIEDAIRLYDAEIAYADDELGRLFAELKSLDLYEESLIIVTSDHGEAFYEHGHWTHMVSLYDEVTRIPLIVKLPFGRRKGRVDTPVSQTDVFPTVLRITGISAPHTMALSLHEPEALGDGGRSIVSELTSKIGYRHSCTDRALSDCTTMSIRSDTMKYITTLVEESGGIQEAVQELYDISSDPFERDELSGERPVEAEAMRQRVRAFLRLARSWDAKTEDVTLDDDVTEQLRSLGYIE